MDTPFRLLIAARDGTSAWDHGHDDDLLVVPQGVSSLCWEGMGHPRLEPVGATGSEGAPRLDAVDGRRLLLAVPPEAGVGLNGAPAPRLTRLASADRIDLPAGVTLHVARVRSGAPVSVPAELVGECCGLCRVPLTAETHVWICDACGAAMHLEPEGVPEATRLTCALLASSCTQCQGPLDLGTGLDHVPAR
jgi:hypothetical protein